MSEVRGETLEDLLDIIGVGTHVIEAMRRVSVIHPNIAVVYGVADDKKEMEELIQLAILVNLAFLSEHISEEEAGLHFAEVVRDVLKAGWVREVQ